MRWIVLGLLALIAFGAALYGSFEMLLAPVGTSSRAQLVVIQPGSGVPAIARQLERQRLLRSDVAFRLWLRLAGQDRAIKAGIYAVAPNMGARGIAELLVEGRGETARVTVPEGYSLRQIAASLEKRTAGAGHRFITLAGNPAAFAAEFPWLQGLPAGASLEGFLFPDTYVVTPGPEAEGELVRLMLARFEQVALPVAGRSTSYGLGLLQTVTMASIVEKEAIHPKERPTIAGVFYNRLAQRMPFGSDPTVEYVLDRHQGAKGLSLRDVAVASPYNTYIHQGLPPGPIANPGLASLEAAVQPARTRYMYFVARGDGRHAFTHTYAEHLAMQRRILHERAGG